MTRIIKWLPLPTSSTSLSDLILEEDIWSSQWTNHKYTPWKDFYVNYENLKHNIHKPNASADNIAYQIKTEWNKVYDFYISKKKSIVSSDMLMEVQYLFYFTKLNYGAFIRLLMDFDRLFQYASCDSLRRTIYNKPLWDQFVPLLQQVAQINAPHIQIQIVPKQTQYASFWIYPDNIMELIVSLYDDNFSLMDFETPIQSMTSVYLRDDRRPLSILRWYKDQLEATLIGNRSTHKFERRYIDSWLNGSFSLQSAHDSEIQQLEYRVHSKQATPSLKTEQSRICFISTDTIVYIDYDIFFSPCYQDSEKTTRFPYGVVSIESSNSCSWIYNHLLIPTDADAMYLYGLDTIKDESVTNIYTHSRGSSTTSSSSSATVSSPLGSSSSTIATYCTFDHPTSSTSDPTNCCKCCITPKIINIREETIRRQRPESFSTFIFKTFWPKSFEKEPLISPPRQDIDLNQTFSRLSVLTTVCVMVSASVICFFCFIYSL